MVLRQLVVSVSVAPICLKDLSLVIPVAADVLAPGGVAVVTSMHNADYKVTFIFLGVYLAFGDCELH